MERIEKPVGDANRGGRRGPRITLKAVSSTGRDVLRLKGVGKSYGERAVLSDLDLLVDRGQRIGVIGANGSGKTTLIRLLAGELTPDTGLVIPGEGVRIGYFAQGQAELDGQATVLDHVLAVRDLTIEEARRHLAAFLFFGDEIFAPVGRLSGGERNRVALAQLILRQPNVLLLDEPTNHLDIAARTALEAALAEYDGTLIVVSHDRYFLDTVCDSLWIVQDSRVSVFDGTYSEYARRRREEAASSGGVGAGARAGWEPAPERVRARAPGRIRQQAPVLGPVGRRKRYGGPGRRARRLRQQAERIASVEQAIERWEAEKRSLEEALAIPDCTPTGNGRDRRWRPTGMPPPSWNSSWSNGSNCWRRPNRSSSRH